MKQSVKLVSANSAIVSKVYLPKHILIFVKMYANGFKMAVSYVLVAIMMAIYRVPLSLNIVYIIPIFVTLIMFTFGVSTIMLHFGVFVEDLSNVINVLLKLVFYMSGIFYSISNRVKEPYGSILLNFNPVALFLNDLRLSMIYCEAPHRKLLLMWYLVSCAMSAIGIRIIYKYENSYVKVM